MSARILIVDDEPVNLVTMEGFLSADGYDLHYAENGRDAVAKARALRPDLILLDIMMPEMDGFRVCQQIREDAEIGRIPILIVTALHDQASRLEGLRAGADDFITKPCSRDEVRARVRTIASLNRFRALAEQQTRFEALYELSPAAIVLTDDAGTVQNANRQAHACFGADGAPVVGARLGERLLPADAVGDAIAAALRQEPFSREVRQPGGDAGRVHLLRSAAVPDGTSARVMLVFDDVTIEVQAREALRRSNEELEEMVRARTRQLEDANGLLLSYANFVSHDLRSPLAVMKGYLDLLQEGMPGIPADAKPMIRNAHRAAGTMAEMIQNILQLAREIHASDEAARPPLDAARVLNRLVMHVQEVVPNPSTQFTVRPLPQVGVSSALLERVFFNLLTNAAKFSAAQDVPTIEIGSVPHDEGVVLYVRDNGVGFDARQTDKLFREFSRLETAAKTDGLGLGLSLVARLVRSVGGRMWAESTVGSGATFYVLLPRPVAAQPAGRLAAG